MNNNTNDKILKAKIEEYVKEKGWNGFFGLLATISPEKVDREDLKKYNEEKEMPAVEEEQFGQQIQQNTSIEQEVKNASIYAAEHINAVQDDLREQTLAEIEEKKLMEEPKVKVLEPPKNHAPNPWGEAKVVLPGELDF